MPCHSCIFVSERYVRSQHSGGKRWPSCVAGRFASAIRSIHWTKICFMCGFLLAPTNIFFVIVRTSLHSVAETAPKQPPASMVQAKISFVHESRHET